MLFTTEDWILIKHYRLDRNMHDFPNKPWSASGLDKLIKTENWPPSLEDLLEEKREELPPYEIDACINQFRV